MFCTVFYLSTFYIRTSHVSCLQQSLRQSYPLPSIFKTLTFHLDHFKPKNLHEPTTKVIWWDHHCLTAPSFQGLSPSLNCQFGVYTALRILVDLLLLLKSELSMSHISFYFVCCKQCKCATICLTASLNELASRLNGFDTSLNKYTTGMAGQRTEHCKTQEQHSSREQITRT